MWPRAAFLALLLGAAAAALAAEPVTPACAAPDDLRATPLAAWTQSDGDAVAAIEVGRPVSLALTDGGTSRALRIGEPGRYGIAADGKLWIDVIAGGAAAPSVEHGHGPACSGIRKIVWFDLAAGTHQLALSKAASARVRLLVVRAP